MLHVATRRLARVVCITAVFLFSLCITTPAAYGQALASNTTTVTLTAVLGETLTLASSPSGVSFALVSGGAAVSNMPVTITTTWVLAASRMNVVLDAYFASSSAALTYAGPPSSVIPSANVFGQDTAGTPTSYTAFTQTAALGTAGAGLTIFTVPLTASNRAFVRSDTLNLKIDLSTLGQLPSGTYTGTMTLAAQAL